MELLARIASIVSSFSVLDTKITSVGEVGLAHVMQIPKPSEYWVLVGGRR